MKYFFYILFFLLVGFLGYSTGAVGKEIDCKKHRIYCKIIDLRPGIDKKFAMRFSNIIYKKAKKYNLDPIRSVAIAMQESSLRQINRKQSVLLVTEDCSSGECEKTYKKVTGLTDVSIWQFHIETAAAYGKDFCELQENLEYATDFHFKLMKDKVNMCKHLGEEAWTCYHSVTERHRKLYKKMVDRFFYEDKK